MFWSIVFPSYTNSEWKLVFSSETLNFTSGTNPKHTESCSKQQTTVNRHWRSGSTDQSCLFVLLMWNWLSSAQRLQVTWQCYCKYLLFQNICSFSFLNHCLDVSWNLNFTTVYRKRSPSPPPPQRIWCGGGTHFQGCSDRQIAWTLGQCLWGANCGGLPPLWAWELAQPVQMHCVNLEKAYDQGILWEMFQEYGVDDLKHPGGGAIWFRHLVRIHPWCLPGEVFFKHVCSGGDPGADWEHTGEIGILSGRGTPWHPVSGSGWVEGSLGFPAETPTPATRPG